LFLNFKTSSMISIFLLNLHINLLNLFHIELSWNTHSFVIFFSLNVFYSPTLFELKYKY